MDSISDSDTLNEARPAVRDYGEVCCPFPLLLWVDLPDFVVAHKCGCDLPYFYPGEILSGTGVHPSTPLSTREIRVSVSLLDS